MAGEPTGRILAILGGGERVRELARPARAGGGASVADAVAGADAIILPVPGFDNASSP
jgi:hypothetical protein